MAASEVTLWGLHPLFWIDVSVFACHILQAKPFEGDGVIACIGGHPVRKVALCGTIVSFKRGAGRYDIALDDGTGVIDIQAWTTLPGGAPNVTMPALELGQAVQVRGSLKPVTWGASDPGRPAWEVSAHSVTVCDSFLDLLTAWADTVRLWRQEYSKSPATLAPSLPPAVALTGTGAAGEGPAGHGGAALGQDQVAALVWQWLLQAPAGAAVSSVQAHTALAAAGHAVTERQVQACLADLVAAGDALQVGGGRTFQAAAGHPALLPAVVHAFTLLAWPAAAAAVGGCRCDSGGACCLQALGPPPQAAPETHDSSGTHEGIASEAIAEKVREVWTPLRPLPSATLHAALAAAEGEGWLVPQQRGWWWVPGDWGPLLAGLHDGWAHLQRLMRG